MDGFDFIQFVEINASILFIYLFFIIIHSFNTIMNSNRLINYSHHDNILIFMLYLIAKFRLIALSCLYLRVFLIIKYDRRLKPLII